MSEWALRWPFLSLRRRWPGIIWRWRRDRLGRCICGNARLGLDGREPQYFALQQQHGFDELLGLPQADLLCSGPQALSQGESTAVVATAHRWQVRGRASWQGVADEYYYYRSGRSPCHPLSDMSLKTLRRERPSRVLVFFICTIAAYFFAVSLNRVRDGPTSAEKQTEHVPRHGSGLDGDLAPCVQCSRGSLAGWAGSSTIESCTHAQAFLCTSWKTMATHCTRGASRSTTEPARHPASRSCTSIRCTPRPTSLSPRQQGMLAYPRDICACSMTTWRRRSSMPTWTTAAWSAPFSYRLRPSFRRSYMCTHGRTSVHVCVRGVRVCV